MRCLTPSRAACRDAVARLWILGTQPQRYVLCMERVWAYVFVDTENPGPKRVVREIRRLEGVIRADALLGTPDIIAIVEGEDIAEMDAVIDRIAGLPGVLDTESKVARWID